MVIVQQGDHVWLLDKTKRDGDVPIGAVVKLSDSGQVKVTDDSGKDHWLKTPLTNIRIMHPTSVKGVQDMIRLGDLNEHGILRNLLIRYNEDQIYTYTGSILVAVNPYRDLPLYEKDSINRYTDRKIGELPPHIFAIADNAYANMLKNKTNQCVIVSGESGAGKTESTKHVMQYLAATSGQRSWIEQQILEANPILEAFGNAKTIRNDNSSRFGKFIEIRFNSSGVIQSAKIDQYLLEKSRLVYQSADERNYHIFYCMLAGLTREWKVKLGLGQPSDYINLTQGSCLQCAGRNDKAEWTEILNGMKVLDFTNNEIYEIQRILAAILHTGNLRFKEALINNLDAVEFVHTSELKLTSELFGVNDQAFARALTQKTLRTRGEVVTSPMNISQANDVKDACIKGVYGRLFVWVVDKINSAINREARKKDKKGSNSIGLLDIFGFENFDNNSFEQLCINFANENLQQFFVRHVFKLEQEEYNIEGISWQHINFRDNQDVLNMMSADQMNIFALINEEAVFPRGTDRTLLDKLTRHHANNKLFIRPKTDRSETFGIEHFAGTVHYSCNGFLARNKDTFHVDLLQLIKSSKNAFLKLIFHSDLKEIKSTQKRTQTLVVQFKQSLDLLMRTLSKCQPFFVRCIKPNSQKVSKKFNRGLVARQLRYSGMMETIKIRRAGYPIRYTFAEFINRFRVISPGILPADREKNHIDGCKTILERALGANSDWQIGKTKIFIKDSHDALLDSFRERMLTKSAIVIQRAIRGWFWRLQFLRKRKAAVQIQSWWKTIHAKRQFDLIRSGLARLQAVWRGRKLAFDYRFARKRIVQLQARCRGFIVRREACHRLWAIVKIQAFVRGCIARAELRQLRRIKAIKKLPKSQQKAALQKLEEEERNFRKKLRENNKILNDAERRKRQDMSSADDSAMVDDVFGYLEYEETVSNPDVIETSIPKLEEEDDISEYKFSKFAATYFQSTHVIHHVKKEIKIPLLLNENEGDRMASLAVWVTILRFMGDLPEPKPRSEEEELVDKKPVMNKIYDTLGRSYKSKKQIEDKFNTRSKRKLNSAKGKKLISMTLKKKSKLTGEVANKLKNEEDYEGDVNQMLIDRPTSNLEKLHFIIGNGILRPSIRTEIYCQICKQLTQNKSRSSHARGWILMSLCVGCFAPDENFEKYLRNFIRSGPPNYAPYCDSRMRRTFANGARTQPPSWLELQATKSKKPIMLPITFMDGTTKTLLADSATTAKELCDVLAEKINLQDRFGFSLFISLLDKVSSLGQGNDHVMDAISQCEQYAKEQGAQEKNAPWRLFYRKEIFTPWHNSALDETSTNLIYQQIVRGVKFGEYRCQNDNEMSQLCSKQYYIEYGTALQSNMIDNALSSYLPDRAISQQKGLRFWSDKLQKAHQESKYVRERWEPQRVREDVVTEARFQWPLLFSRFFEAYHVAGPSLAKDRCIVAINWTGVYFMDEDEKVLLEVPYAEITGIQSTVETPHKVKGKCFTLSSARGNSRTFGSINSEDITELITEFVEGLKERSRYAIALHDSNRGERDEINIIPYKRGDLIELDKPAGKNFTSVGWRSGANDRNGRSGEFPTDGVYILPTISAPPQDLVSVFSMSPVELEEQFRNMQTQSLKEEESEPYTLEEYSIDFFRAPLQQTMSRAPTSRRGKEKLWCHSRDMLKQPLLKKIMHDNDMVQEGIAIFLAIMKYMGDYPTRKTQLGSEITDQIFEAPLKYEILKDEVYCQIMKQLTKCKNSYSEERGWELMWLATGIFAPSNQLLPHLQKFLSTRRSNILANDCFFRYQRPIRHGQRKYPPHVVEVEAIQNRTTQIFHKIYFPDDTSEAFEVESCTKAKDFCKNIANRLRLKSADGFSLFVKIGDKVISVPEGDFFFDFVRHLTDWIRRAKPTADGGISTLTYQVFFMKKLWAGTVPGRDPNADNMFHFYQEKQKYLRGYHKLNKEEAFQIAALLFRAKHGDDKSQLSNVPRMLKELAPLYLLRQSSPDDWKKRIIFHYNKNPLRNRDEAKLTFLKTIYKFPTFGSAFFEVRQTTDQSYPENLVIAINKHGVSLIDPKTKTILNTYPFTKISNWSSGNTYFHMTIGSLVRGNKLLCETAMGYKMDDLLTSYISLLLNAIRERSKRRL